MRRLPTHLSTWGFSGLRNVFDQFSQPENRLTHALVCTLSNERALIRPFLRWLGVKDLPPLRDLDLVEQQVPGIAVPADEDESRGLPDACVYTKDGWAVLLEAKVQSKVSVSQLRRHRATARRYGYENPWLVVVSVDAPSRALPRGTLNVVWRDVYHWFSMRASQEGWARTFVDYMRVFESRMLAQDYGIRGTLTMFDGLRFDADNPYTYREGKRLMRLLGDELQHRRDLVKLGVDPKGQRRPAIRGRGTDLVWDFLPLKVARKAKQFTNFPHLDMAIGREHALAIVAIPNGVRGGFRTRLRRQGAKGLHDLLSEVEVALRPVLDRSKGAKAALSASQRHYRSQSSPAVVDGRMEADLRTAVPGDKQGVKYQPEWVNAMYALLCNKRSNIHFQVEVRFNYSCPHVRSRRVVDLFADAWKAMWPIAEFVLED